MNMKTIIRTLYACLLLCMLSCSKDGQSPYLAVSVSSYTFSGDDDYVLKVAVASSSDWTSSVSEDWIAASPKGDTLEISVSANDTGDMRDGEVTVSSSATGMQARISVSQLPARFSGRFEDLFYLGKDAVMSRNGRFVCGMRPVGTESVYVPVVIDTRTGEQTELPEVADHDAVMAISDDGSTIVVRNVSSATSMVLRNGEPVEMKLPSGCQYPFVSGMSSDGSVLVGYCKNGNVTGYKPYIPVQWVNGEPEILPYPDHTVWGDEYLMDTMARGCSDDGGVVFGSEWTDYGLVYWKGGKLYFPGQDYADASETAVVASESTRTNISPDGRYIGCFRKTASGTYPAVIDTQDGSLHEFREIGDGACFHVTNDGNAFCGTPFLATTYGYVADVSTGSFVKLSDWMKENHGITLSENRYVTQVSSDGSTFFGIQTLESANGTAFVSWYCYVGE